VLKIERNIPRPEKPRGKSKGYTATIAALKPGESVPIPSTYESVYQLARRVNRDGDREFQIAKEEGLEDGLIAYRVWRVA